MFQFKKILLTCLAATCVLTQGSEPAAAQASTTTYAVLCPGISNFGGDSFKQNLVINTPLSRYDTLAKTTKQVDLGQTNVVNHFIKQFKADKTVEKLLEENKKILVVGVSQGTAGAVGIVTNIPREKQKQEIGGIVLESVLGSAQSATLHQAMYNRTPIIHALTYIPFFAGLRMPALISKYTQFPTLQAFGGRDLLSSIKNISPEIPLIILGDVNDPQVSINDGRQAYINAINHGNTHAYLMETNSGVKRHIDLLGDGPTPGEAPNNGPSREADIPRIAALQAIYKKEGLPFKTKFEKNGTSTDLTQLIDATKLNEYQPSVRDVERKIYLSTRTSRWARNAIDLGTLIALTAGVYRYLKTNR